jgi:hypothetical protein
MVPWSSGYGGGALVIATVRICILDLATQDPVIVTPEVALSLITTM